MSSPIPQRTRMNRLPTDRVEQVSVVETRLQDLNIEHADLLHRLEEIALLRAKLLRERNDLCVPTHILPAEVLSRIFMMVSSPIRLSAVCAYWREVAEGAPLLWRSIICRMSRKDIQGDTKNCVHRLRLFLKNSGLVKVSLHLHVDGWKMSNNGHAVREILTIITQEANDQIQTLRLRSSAPWDRRVTETVYFHVYPAHFPSLLVLDIGSELDHPRHRLNAPHLRKLILTDAPSAKWSFNQKFWDHLTAIRIDRTVVTRSDSP
ncbi:hypothetical protein NP233_g8954 [Leucocoprinus birnbaumii]|uniref:F-box domain-containing protein n=1 Tax=Leucocoprinus birnbaumii TaxID=56174 RepID=A0AAD5VLH6_9AGAR|nr:hypothetical protein NP233_g8954 [Leucocoprinus birnbaumii]